MRYIAKEDFKSLTGKEFKKGDIVLPGDATSMMKYLSVEGEELKASDPPEDLKPEENKVMTTKDLKTKTKKAK